MSTNDATAVSGIEMDDREIDEFLRTQGHGILSLAAGGDAYGVPISFGYEVESWFAWRSSLVRGTLHPVPDGDADHVESVMDDNAWFPTIFPPTSPVTEVRRRELLVEEASGLKGEANQE